MTHRRAKISAAATLVSLVVFVVTGSPLWFFAALILTAATVSVAGNPRR